MITGIMLPMIFISIFYFKILLKAFELSSEDARKNILTRKKKVPTKKSHNPIKIAKGLFASFLLFVLCWLPYGLLILIDSNDELPAAAYMYSMTLAHLSPALTPILYALTNSQIKNGYINFFNLMFFRRKYKYA
jgi:hypothetical protein